MSTCKHEGCTYEAEANIDYCRGHEGGFDIGDKGRTAREHKPCDDEDCSICGEIDNGALDYEAWKKAPCEVCNKPRDKHRRYSRYTSPANGCPEFREPSIEKSFACLRCGVDSEDRTTFKLEDEEAKSWCADCLFETGRSTDLSVKYAAFRDGKCWQCKGLLTPIPPFGSDPHPWPCSDCKRKNDETRRYRHLDLLEDWYTMHPDKMPKSEPIEPGPLSDCCNGGLRNGGLLFPEPEVIDLAAEGEALKGILSAIAALSDPSKQRVLEAVRALVEVKTVRIYASGSAFGPPSPGDPRVMEALERAGQVFGHGDDSDEAP